MRTRAAGVSIAFLVPVLLTVAGCKGNTPVQPSGSNSTSGTSGGGTSGTAAVTPSIAAPRPISPAQNATIRNQEQPVTLVVQNAVVTRSTTTKYTFQVAGDAGFANVMRTLDDVPEGGGGQTGVRVDPLPADKPYWFRARASAGSTTGIFGPSSKFIIGPAITLDPPTPISPTTGAQVGLRPTFTIGNANRSGPITGPISYLIQVSDNGSFNPVTFSQTVPEGLPQTTYTPGVDLVANRPHTWRAFTIDQNDGITSAPSAVQVFTPTASPPGGGGSAAAAIAQQLGLTLWPGNQPPGATGRATLGDNWEPQNKISHGGVPYQSPPIDGLRIFDLMDRGYDPQGAIDWMHANGYPTAAQNFPERAVIGLTYQYMAFIRGRWDLVDRGEGP